MKLKAQCLISLSLLIPSLALADDDYYAPYEPKGYGYKSYDSQTAKELREMRFEMDLAEAKRTNEEITEMQRNQTRGVILSEFYKRLKASESISKEESTVSKDALPRRPSVPLPSPVQKQPAKK